MSGAAFAGSVPENYERYLVPLIFEYYADDLTARAQALGPAAVLETACGTGAVTRRLAAALPEAAITATDLNEGMLAVARDAAAAGNAAYQTADATDLPFDDGAFDAMVCQFGVMFYPDKAKGYREAARVLKPGGTYLFNVWDSLDENVFAGMSHGVAKELFPDDPPEFLGVPFGYYDVTAIFRELQAAGFGEVTATALPHESRAPTARDVAAAYGAGSPLGAQLAERGEDAHRAYLEQLEAKIRDRCGDGEVAAPMQAIVFTACKP